VADRRRLRRLAEGTLALREELSWSRTLESLDELLKEARTRALP
jgi:hypothetical protein